LRLLRRVRVLAGRVNFQLLEHRVPQRSLREHALDGDFESPRWEPRLHLVEGGGVHTAGIGAVAIVDLVLALLASDSKLAGVDHDDVVADVDVRSELGLVLTPQAARYFCGEPSEYLTACVDQIPVALDLVRLG